MSNAKRSSAVRFFCLTFVILLISSVFIWGFQTGWGQIKIDRLMLSGDNGEAVSTLIYVPKTATNENPAPVVVINHGRSNHGHSNDTWSMELARRGYVVLSPDLAGGGESAATSRENQAVVVTNYANSLPFVIKDSINIVGYSAGIGTSGYVYRQMPDKVNSMCMVFGPFLASISGGFSDIDTNYCLIKSTADQYDWDFLGDPDGCLAYMRKESGIADLVPNQDYTVNGHVFHYAQIGGTLHQTGNISGAVIEQILAFVTAVAPAPIALNLSDTAWLPQQIFSGIACVTMMFMLAAIINLLMQNPFFATIANPVPVKAPRRGAKAWCLDVLFTTIIPALIFVHVSAYVMKWTGAGTGWEKIFTSNNLNGIMGWLLVVAVIGIIRMVIHASQDKKNGVVRSLGSYALGADGDTRIDWTKPAKALLMALITITFVGAWMWLLEAFLGIDYQVWCLSTYVELSPARILRAIPYILIIFTVMFIGNLNQRVLPSTGNDRKDMWIAVAVNSVLTASALFVVLVLQYGGSMIIGTGQTIIPQIDIWGTGVNKSAGALDFAFGYCYMMGGTTGVVTYLYRKFGNIWCGVIPCAVFAGMFTLASFTLIY
ncbi:MAG: alpha/beta hydrolase [Clostridiales bacterium]|nr:alpha/beta hydrolase [Clostridiales bacterium]